MKKYSYLKIIGIILAVLVVLSWIFSAATFGQTGVYDPQVVYPIGLLDLIRIPSITFANFINYGVFMLVLGGFYGVMNKTGAYSVIVDKLVKKFKTNKTALLIMVALFFAVISAITGVNLVLFIAIPFFLTVLIKLNYRKTTALFATVGAVIVGNFASMFAFSFNGYVVHFYKLSFNTNIIAKSVLLLLSLVALVVYLFIDSRNTNHEKDVALPLFEKVETKRSYKPLLIVAVAALLLMILGNFNWEFGIGVTFFNQLFTDIQAIKIGDYTIILNLIGNIGAIGWWSLSDVVILLIVEALVIGWLYSLKLKEIYEGFMDGAKQMLVPALYVVMANIILGAFTLSSYASQNGNYVANIYLTIFHNILNMTKGFNVFTTSLLGAVSGIFHNDYSTIIATTVADVQTTITTTDSYPLFTMILQMFHGMFMLIMPTSLILVAGLSYLKVSFVEWFKYIWRFLLILLGIAVIMITVISLL